MIVLVGKNCFVTNKFLSIYNTDSILGIGLGDLNYYDASPLRDFLLCNDKNF